MQISEAWVAGESVEGIARRYRLSYGRVSQIVHGRPDLRAERDRRQRAAEMRKRRSVQAWSSRHPGAPLAEAAALFGLDEAELKKILGERAPLHSAPRPTPTPVFSDDEIHQALAEFLAEGTVRRSDYDLVSTQRGWPSSSTVITRLGSWSAALASAGHHTTSRHIRDGSNPADVARLDALLEHVADLDRAAADALLAGAGAAGGLGFALVHHLGATLVPGIDLVMRTVGLEQLLKDADLVVTGEGSIDAQTLQGKTPMDCDGGGLSRQPCRGSSGPRRRTGVR